MLPGSGFLSLVRKTSVALRRLDKDLQVVVEILSPGPLMERNKNEETIDKEQLSERKDSAREHLERAQDAWRGIRDRETYHNT